MVRARGRAGVGLRFGCTRLTRRRCSRLASLESCRRVKLLSSYSRCSISSRRTRCTSPDSAECVPLKSCWWIVSGSSLTSARSSRTSRELDARCTWSGSGLGLGLGHG